jgi:hypothetical protein
MARGLASWGSVAQTLSPIFILLRPLGLGCEGKPTLLA